MATARRWKLHEGTRWPTAPRRAVERRRRERLLWLLLLLLLLLGAALGLWLVLRRGAGLPVLGIMRGPGAHYVFSVNNVEWPLAVAASHDGRRIYVAEGEGERVVKVLDRQGRQIGALAPPDTEPIQRLPVAVAVAPNGDVYVSDTLLGSLSVYSTDGEFLRSLPPPEGQEGWAALGLDVDEAGNLYVVSTTDRQHRVEVYDPQGQLLRRFGEEGEQPGKLAGSRDIAVDRQGRVYVTNMYGGVDVFTAEGVYQYSIGERAGQESLGLPLALSVDDDGRLFVVDLTNHRVVVYKVDGESGSFSSDFAFGSLGRDDGEFRYPDGVAADGTRRVYVADRENNRLQVWSY